MEVSLRAWPKALQHACWLLLEAKHYQLLPDFKVVAKCTSGQGSSVMLWQDNWRETIRKQKFLELFSFAVQEQVYVKDFLVDNKYFYCSNSTKFMIISCLDHVCFMLRFMILVVQIL